MLGQRAGRCSEADPSVNGSNSRPEAGPSFSEAGPSLGAIPEAGPSRTEAGSSSRTEAGSSRNEAGPASRPEAGDGGDEAFARALREC